MKTCPYTRCYPGLQVSQEDEQVKELVSIMLLKSCVQAVGTVPRKVVKMRG